MSAEITALVARIAEANRRWGAPRIPGEPLKLGIDVVERTVSNLIPKRHIAPSQPWGTFLTNHVRDLVSIDCFAVPTAPWRMRFVLVVRAHHRRRVLHVHVTEHPTAAWMTQQISGRPPGRHRAVLSPPRSGHDRRSHRPATCAGHADPGDPHSPRSPWQNPFVERLIGSVPRE